MTIIPIQLPPGIVRGANPDDAPGRWFDGNLIRWRGGIMEPVGDAPTSNRAVIVTPERHAMLLQVGGDKRRIAWSSREDYTDWNFASTTNTAGFLHLSTKTWTNLSINFNGVYGTSASAGFNRGQTVAVGYNGSGTDSAVVLASFL